MEANELRIGNFIKDRSGKILQIDWMEQDKVCQRMKIEGSEVHPLTEYFEYLRPIPLIEQWLKDFGFEKIEKYIYRIKCNKYSVYLYVYGLLTVGIGQGESRINFTEIKYVHQLQNLCFALTNTELIKN